MINKPYMGKKTVDIELEKKEVMYWRKKLAEIIALHTSQTIEKIYQDTEQDYFMSAMEAKDYGIIDLLVTDRWPQE